MPEAKTKRTKTGSTSRTRKSGEAERPAPACTVAFCPICLMVTAAQGAAPDAVEHLLNAARELFLFARAVVEDRAGDLDGRERPGPRKLQRIEIA